MAENDNRNSVVDMAESDCDTCGGWAVGDFTFQELCGKWRELIGGKITDGYARRYQREGERLGIPWEEIRLTFKYCTRGRLTRFYIVKGLADTRSKKSVCGCPQFFLKGVDASEFPVPSPLWTVCLTESHGPTRVKGQHFVPGLCENRVYFRLPTHGKVEPEREETGQCDVCGKEFEEGLVVREVTRFCCNKHYLQWWRERHPEAYRKFNPPGPGEGDGGTPS